MFTPEELYLIFEHDEQDARLEYISDKIDLRKMRSDFMKLDIVGKWKFCHELNLVAIAEEEDTVFSKLLSYITPMYEWCDEKKNWIKTKVFEAYSNENFESSRQSMRRSANLIMNRINHNIVLTKNVGVNGYEFCKEKLNSIKEAGVS